MSAPDFAAERPAYRRMTTGGVHPLHLLPATVRAYWDTRITSDNGPPYSLPASDAVVIARKPVPSGMAREAERAESRRAREALARRGKPYGTAADPAWDNEPLGCEIVGDMAKRLGVTENAVYRAHRHRGVRCLTLLMVRSRERAEAAAKKKAEKAAKVANQRPKASAKRRKSA